jgi:SnoaL-like domain
MKTLHSRLASLSLLTGLMLHSVSQPALAYASHTSQSLDAPTQTTLTNQPTAMATLDLFEIIEVVNAIAIMADLRDWQAVRSAFADEVTFDYTAIFGGEAATVSADTQIQQWEAFFDATFATTQHLVGSHVVTVEENRATVISHYQAHHTYLDASKTDWVLAGSYTHELVNTSDGWQVTKMVATKLWETGDRPF